MKYLYRWEPFQEAVRLQNQMDQMIQKLLGQKVSREEEVATTTTDWLPPIDVSESPEAFEVKVELPGIDPKDIGITVTDDLVTIKGQKKADEEQKGWTYHCFERSYGVFQRTIRLPSETNGEQVKARYCHGVLILDVPKKQEVKPKPIKIEIK